MSGGWASWTLEVWSHLLRSPVIKARGSPWSCQVDSIPKSLRGSSYVTSALLCVSVAGRLPEQHRQRLRGVLPPTTQAFRSPAPIPAGSSLPTLLGTHIAGCSLCLTQVAPTLLEAPGPGVKASDSCRGWRGNGRERPPLSEPATTTSEKTAGERSWLFPRVNAQRVG